MTNQQILTKAIEKAIAGGCTYFDTEHFLVKHYTEGMKEEPAEWPSVNDIIFDHDFAKAIAGDDWTKFLCDLVVELDPIKELEKWL